jgi:hypothetical protein
MMLRREHLIRWALLLPFLAVLSAGCIFNPDKKDPPIVPPVSNFKVPTTITNVIHNLKQAYIEKNYDEYAKLFTEDYQYIFDPNDTGVPDSWVLGDELDVHRNMFGGEANRDGNYVTDIQLAFTENEPDTDPQFPEYSRVVLSAVDLRVDTRNKDNGDVTLYLTPAGTQAHLYFLQTDEVHESNQQRIWKIVVWKDAGTGGGLLAAR